MSSPSNSPPAPSPPLHSRGSDSSDSSSVRTPEDDQEIASTPTTAASAPDSSPSSALVPDLVPRRRLDLLFDQAQVDMLAATQMRPRPLFSDGFFEAQQELASYLILTAPAVEERITFALQRAVRDLVYTEEGPEGFDVELRVSRALQLYRGPGVPATRKKRTKARRHETPLLRQLLFLPHQARAGAKIV